MRVKETKDHLTVQAIGGTHVVLLGMSVPRAERAGLLGFAIHREDVTEGESYWLRGLKTFKDVVPQQTPGEHYSLLEHPIQSFRWSDYTAKPGHTYRFEVVPMKGTPKNLQPQPSITVEVKTESEGDPKEVHDVYFNRGVSGSQAYVRRFGPNRPDALSPEQQDKAYEWLSRGLEQAMLAFIGQATDGTYSLRAAVYEFNYKPVLEALRAANQAGADVRILYDARGDNPKDSTEQALQDIGIANLAVPRSTNTSFIAHNKFIVLLKNNKPLQVWTGSTNVTRGGIFGQSNVGHIVRDETIAKAYLDYWDQLVADPEAADLRVWIEGHTPDPSGPPPAKSVTALFSPRKKLDVLEWYADRLNDADDSAHLTAAFGVHALLEDVLRKQKAHLRFVLQERRDAQQDEWTVDRDVQTAVGGKISGDALYGWTHEILTGFNFHVNYIHDKFMLVDPLSNDPVVITGSANFSEASVKRNDENMLVIRGDTRVADIYLGEFMRLFSHHYFRDLIRKQQGENLSTPRNLFLSPDDSWTRPYFEQYSVKAKIRRLFSGVAE